MNNCYLVSKQQKTFSQLIGMIESPADVKIVYRMGSQISHFTKTPKFSPTFPGCNALVCHIFFNTSPNQPEVNYFLQIQPKRRPNLSSVVEPGRQHHSSLHPLSVNKILEQKRSMTSEFLYTVIFPIIITKTKFSNLIGYQQPRFQN